MDKVMPWTPLGPINRPALIVTPAIKATLPCTITSYALAALECDGALRKWDRRSETGFLQYV